MSNRRILDLVYLALSILATIYIVHTGHAAAAALVGAAVGYWMNEVLPGE